MSAPLPKARASRRRFAKRWLIAIFALLALIGLLQWRFPILAVRQGSMQPTLRAEGDTIVLQRAPVQLARFDLGVWRSPAGTLAIKRAIAFAGERVDLKGGDVFVQEPGGALRRPERSRELRERMRTEIFPRTGAFIGEEGGLWFGGPPPYVLAGRRPMERAWLVVAGSRQIRDGSLRDADGSVDPGRHAVADLTIDLEIASIQAGAEFRLLHRLRAPEADVGIQLSAAGLVFGRGAHDREGFSPIARWPLITAPCALRLETCDGEFLLSRIVNRSDVDLLYRETRDTLSFGTASELSIERFGGTVVLASLAVSRDVHYYWHPSATIPTPGPVLVRAGCFALGDHPALSHDSRTAGPFADEAFFGRAMGIIWPPARRRFLP